MDFFSRIFNALRGGPSADSDRYIPVYVLSTRCRELIAGQVDVMNEVSLADEGEGYYVRKVLHTSGRNRCFGQVEIELWLDRNRRISHHEIHGGQWLTAAEFNAEQIRQAAEEARVAAEAEAAAESDSERQPPPPKEENGAN